ncbi:MAG: hypothetical protein JXA18_03815 [Chitinispirillaceae bacterium]|nr:hypothetical protein [Chitinispirillaceae bacterium]
MRIPVVAFFFIITGICFSVSGTALSIYAGNDFYMYQDGIDSTKGGKDILLDFGFGLENIGGSGLSFITDMKGANVFHDGLSGSELRSPFQLTTAYFDWRSGAGKLRFRLGRQQYTNLSVETFDLDGLRAEICPIKKMAINATIGMYVPTPYVEETAYFEKELLPPVRDTVADTLIIRDTLKEKFKYEAPFLSTPAKSGMLLLDGWVTAIPFTTLTWATTLVPKAFEKTTFLYDTLQVRHTDNVTYDTIADSVVVTSVKETGDFRMALGANVSPISLVRLTGSGRFSIVQKGFDRFDGRLTVVPIELLEVSAYIIGEKGRVDSTNYFSILFHRQLIEYGLTLNAFFKDENIFLEGDYHMVTIADEGIDHFISLDVSNRYLNGGVVLGAGFHGMTVRPYGGAKLPFLKFFSLVGSGEYCFTDETDADNIHHMAVLSGGLKTAIHPIGLTIFPRIEYITNRYFAKDVRFLLTTTLLINHFWGAQQ